MKSLDVLGAWQQDVLARRAALEAHGARGAGAAALGAWDVPAG